MHGEHSPFRNEKNKQNKVQSYVPATVLACKAKSKKNLSNVNIDSSTEQAIDVPSIDRQNQWAW